MAMACAERKGLAVIITEYSTRMLCSLSYHHIGDLRYATATPNFSQQYTPSTNEAAQRDPSLDVLSLGTHHYFYLIHDAALKLPSFAHNVGWAIACVAL